MVLSLCPLTCCYRTDPSSCRFTTHYDPCWFPTYVRSTASLNFLLTSSLLVLGDFGDFGTFAPLLPTVRAETTALNDDPSCMFFNELAWFYLISLQLLLCLLVLFTTIRLCVLPTLSHQLP